MTETAQANRRFVLASYPQGLPREDDFRLETGPRPSPGDGEVLMRLRWLSVDPMIRIFINSAPVAQGGKPRMEPGALIPGAAIGEVVESRSSDFAVGDLLEGRFGWQDYAISNGVGVRRVDPTLAPAETALGVLGLPGFSAFAGLRVAGEITPGQTVLVSGAAGAVGSVVGPLAKSRGARVVGLARGGDKRSYLMNELGYDAVVDPALADVARHLAAALPAGADVYFDNVGGPLFADVLPVMNRRGRVVICGLMAQYNDEDAQVGRDRLPETLTAIMGRSLTVTAFSNVDHHAHWSQFVTEMSALIRSGAVPARTHVEEGLEATPAAFVRLFTASRPGKVLVRL